MTTGLWRRAQAIFDEVVELPSDQRAAALKSACGEDEELRRAVQVLLQADAQEDTGLPSPQAEDLLSALDEERDRQWLGQTLGSWKILRCIGQGGMGSVYLAERADDAFHKQAALKILPLWMNNPENLARFRRERQILALLEHPHIARLLDGGTTDAGLPYLVMEYVEGRSITEHCDHLRLGLRKRVELMKKVAEAVRFAHQNLIVHRDLKASNILVTPDGEPRLLDFGIAKLLEGSELSAAGMTYTHGRLLTPEYASPEQYTGQPITTASDVYSLGVLLYELLVGVRPFSWKGRSPGEVEEALKTRPPSRPSDVVQGRRPADEKEPYDQEAEAQRRRLRPQSLARQLSGDLDNIVLKALLPEPEQRYGSARELADDLDRYLQGLPVLARPTSLTYRTGKFVRRHAVATTAFLAFLSLLVGFAALTYRQSLRLAEERDLARLEQARAEQVARLLVGAFEQADPSSTRGEDLTAREILANGARQVSAELADQPDLEATLLHTLGKVHNHLGLYDEARPLLERSLTLRRELLTEGHPLLLESQHEWASLLEAQGRSEEAEVLLEQTLAQRPSEDPAATAADLHLLAEVRRSKGQRAEAIDLHREALELQRQSLGETHPEVVEGLSQLAHSLFLHGEGEPAEETFREALKIQEQLHPGAHPVTSRILIDLSRLTKRHQKLDESGELAERAVEMNRKLYGEKHPLLASSLHALASVQRGRGRLAEAERLYRESLAVQRAAYGPEHPRLAAALYNLGFFLHRGRNQAVESEPYFREAIEIFSAARGTEHVNFAFFQVGLGGSLVDQGRAQEALPILRQAIDVFGRRSRGGANGRNACLGRSELAGALLTLNRRAEARAHLETCHPVLVESLGEDHEYTLRALARRNAL